MQNLLGMMFFSLCFLFSVKAQVKTEKLATSDFRVLRKAKSIYGFYLGRKQKGSLSKFKVNDCQFIYEKGLDVMSKTEQEYRYERFIINFMGVNKKKESSFDSVSYTNSGWPKSFYPLLFKNSFQNHRLKDVISEEGTQASMSFEKGEKGKAKMILKHIEAYSAENSAFFDPDEARHYTTSIYFDQFEGKKIKINKIIINARRLKSGDLVPSKQRDIKIVELHCSDFKESE
jgi:hypothetical protein